MAIFDVVKRTFQDWSKDNASQMAAALAYYTIFSIPPLLIIILAITGYFLNPDAVQNQLVAQIQGFVGQQTAEFIKTLIVNSRRSPNGLFSSIISVIILLAGASGAFFQLQHALNTIWDVPPDRTRGFWRTIVIHFESFLMVLLIAFLLIVFLIVNGVIAVLITYVNIGPQNSSWPQVINFLSLFIMLTILFALIYRIIPDKHISWGDVWLGASVTTLLFMLGRYAIGFYLTFNKSGSTYGVAGSLIVLLLWIYYSAEIFLFGAEFTHAYAERVGSHHREAETRSVGSGSRNTETTPR